MPAELPDEAIVVRGGQMRPDKLLLRAKRTRREDGMHVLSVWAGLQAAEEDAERLPRGLSARRRSRMAS